MGRKVLLLDTNIFVEALLQQERAQECVQLLQNRDDDYSIALTEFSLYSVGIILEKNGGQAIWKRFLRDCQAASFILVSSSYELEEEILEIAERYELDIDDAHQYEATRRLGAELVSFDRDFDRTDLTRKEPKDFL